MLELDLPLQLDILSDHCLRQTFLGLKFSAVQTDAGPNDHLASMASFKHLDLKQAVRSSREICRWMAHGGEPDLPVLMTARWLAKKTISAALRLVSLVRLE